MNDEDLKNFLEFYNSAENDHIRLLDNKITQIFPLMHSTIFLIIKTLQVQKT